MCSRNMSGRLCDRTHQDFALAMRVTLKGWVVVDMTIVPYFTLQVCILNCTQEAVARQIQNKVLLQCVECAYMGSLCYLGCGRI